MDIKPKSSNPKNNTQDSQQHSYQEPSKSGDSSSALNDFELAFGHVSLTDRAARFVTLVEEMAVKMPNLKNYGVYRIPRLCTGHGSAVAVTKYDQPTDKTVVSVIYFENNESMILSVDNKGQETYDSTINRIDSSFSEAVIEHMIEKGVTNPHYMAANIVPADIALNSAEEAVNIMGQLLISTFSRRRGSFGHLVVDRTQQFNSSLTSFDEDAVQDPNGLPQRADLGIRVQNMPARAQQQSLTLLDDGEARVYEATSLAYVNLRYTGITREEKSKGKEADLRQLTPEVVITLAHTTAHSAFERQLFMLGMWARVAQIGAWRTPLIGRCGADRKFGDVARHLWWGVDTSKINMSEFDKNNDGKSLFLDKFVKQNAAVVISHRVGNGIGGLSSLIADLCEAKTAQNALRQLVTLLDGMFPEITTNGGKQIERPKFTDLLKQTSNSAHIDSSMFVMNMVPSISGSYKGSHGPRSLDDMDFVKVCTYFGDKFADVRAYADMVSMTNRHTDHKETRIRLMKYADEIYGGNSPRFTGEAIHIVLNPKFLALLWGEITARNGAMLNGASAYVKEESSLFVLDGNVDYTVAPTSRGPATNDYGTTSINADSIF